MSQTTQATLSDIAPPETDQDRSNEPLTIDDWDPMGGHKPNSCRNCGLKVSAMVARTCGDENGLVDACPNCCDKYKWSRYATGATDERLENMGRVSPSTANNIMEDKR